MSLVPTSRVELKNKSVMIDGVPHVIFSGEVQQYRLPASEWRDRLEKTAALGLNGIGVYAGWNFHSPEKGVYDFSSPDRDFGKFLDEAQRAGLMVLARLGPYVCNEWDLGGFPGWLLQEDPCDWRTSEPSHLQHSREWYREVNKQIAPRQIDNHGSVILYQVENEHWDGDKGLFDFLAQAAKDDGIRVPLISNGGGSAARCGTKSIVDGCDLYTNQYEQWRWRGYAQLADRLAGDAPLMVVEYAAASFVQWGEKQDKHSFPTASTEWMMTLTRMFLGEGANLVNHFVITAGITPVKYGSDHATTSYFEDAAISPWGGLSEKFYSVRLLAEAVGSVNPILAESRLLHGLWATDNGHVEGLARIGPRGTFVVTVNSRTQDEHFRILLPEGRIVPETGTITIPALSSQLFMVDIACGNDVKLVYSTAQVMKIWQNKKGLNVLVYGESGTAGHTVLSVDGKPVRVDFTCDDNVCVRRIPGAKPLNVYAASKRRAQRTWFVKAGAETVALFSTLDLVRPQVDGGEIRAEIQRAATLNIITDDVALDIPDVKLTTTTRPDGLTEQHATLPERGRVRAELGAATYRAEDYSWITQAPAKEAGWRPIESCAPDREVITNTGAYHYLTSFECSAELPETLEFLGISSAEVVVYLNGQKLGVFPDKRPNTYHELPGYCLCLPLKGVVRPGQNILAFTANVIGRHNTGRPIFAGLTQPIALYRTRREQALPAWEVSTFGQRRYTHSELSQPSAALLAEVAKRPWQKIDLAAPAEELAVGEWLDVRWYRTQVEIPASMQGRPLFLECSKLDDAWCYVNGKCIGRTRSQSSTTFDLSAYSREKSISVVIAARYFWATRTSLTTAPKFVSVDAVLPTTLQRRAGYGDIDITAQRSGFTPKLSSGAQAYWMQREVTVEIPAGIAAPLYVELDDQWKHHALIYWNGTAIGRYASVGPDRRFYIPSGLLKSQNRLAIFVEGHNADAAAGSVSVGAYSESVQLEIKIRK